MCIYICSVINVISVLSEVIKHVGPAMHFREEEEAHLEGTDGSRLEA